MWCNNKFFQQDNGRYQDSEESESSQESKQSSQHSRSSEMESFEEDEKSSDRWSRIQDEAFNRHLERLNALTDEYEQNGDSQQAARIKAENTVFRLSLSLHKSTFPDIGVVDIEPLLTSSLLTTPDCFD